MSRLALPFCPGSVPTSTETREVHQEGPSYVHEGQRSERYLPGVRRVWDRVSRIGCQKSRSVVGYLNQLGPSSLSVSSNRFQCVVSPVVKESGRDPCRPQGPHLLFLDEWARYPGSGASQNPLTLWFHSGRLRRLHVTGATNPDRYGPWSTRVPRLLGPFTRP